jgi:hypothetical protein
MRASRSRLLSAAFLAGAVALSGAPAAEASTTASASTSTNWSGYVAHRGGVRFREVRALWTEPKLTCTPNTPSYSAAWVGLGGYNLTSKALEQVGTEADCRASGTEVDSAWYELVPAPARATKLIVHPGDVMAGRVTVVGNRVTLVLQDRTRHRTFSKTVTDHTLDLSSADWILEAPSQCAAGGLQCQPLALADFGSERFARAKAETASKKTGSISSRMWRTAVITLSGGSDAHRFAGYGGETQGESSPSPLADAGSSFSLTYTPITAPVSPVPAPLYGSAVRSVLPRQR